MRANKKSTQPGIWGPKVDILREALKTQDGIDLICEQTGEGIRETLNEYNKKESLSDIELFVLATVVDIESGRPRPRTIKRRLKMNKKTDTERVKHNVVASKVKKDDLMAFVYYAKVKETKPNRLELHNLDADMDFGVDGNRLIECSCSADQYHEEIKVTKTKAAELLISSHNRPLTVCFEKQDGEERVLRGRLITPEPLLGRSKVEDLDVTGGHRMRLVDHRTIKHLIVDGVKYIVK